MDDDGDQVGVQRPGRLHVRLEPVVVRVGQGSVVVQIEKVDGVLLPLGQAEAVEPVGVGQEGHRDAPHVGHIDAGGGVPLLLGPVGPRVGQPLLLQHVQGPVDPPGPPVQAVVVGGGQQVKARRHQVGGQAVRGVEGGVAGVVRPARQRGLQIGQGVVRPGELLRRVLEHVGKAVSTRGGHKGVVGDGHVAHHIPRRHQADHCGLRFRLRLGLGGWSRLD